MTKLAHRTTIRFSDQDLVIIEKLVQKFGTKNTSDLMRTLIRRLNENLSNRDQ